MLLRALIAASIELAIVIPIVAVAFCRTRHKKTVVSILAVAALILLDEIVLRVPRLGFFSGLQWNWQGKMLEIVLSILTIALLRMSAEESAVGRPRPSWLRPTLWAAAAIFLLPLAFFVAAHARETLTPEGWAFQLTLPGLAEELLFRGVIQGLLNRGFGKQWRFLGAQIGWGWLITSILFAAAHVVSVDRSLHITFMFEEGVGPLVGSLIGGWLRERTGSIWPMVVVHNISNVLIPGLTLQIAD